MKIIRSILFLTFTLLLFSCYSMPASFSQSWKIPEKNTAKDRTKRTIKLVGVSVDRSGGWDSLEKESTVLAPIHFWRKGFRLAEEETADYAAFISLREREFAVGWRTRRSLALEVQVWACTDGMSVNELSHDALSQKLPVAAGRVVVIGKKSFISSKTMGKLLVRAINKTLGKMPPVRRGE